MTAMTAGTPRTAESPAVGKSLRYDDRGAATILVLSATATVVLATTALLGWGAALGTRQRAEGVADLAALSGARHALLGADGCAAAARVARIGGATLAACAVGPRGDVTVVVEADPVGLRLLPLVGDLELPPARARARAGGSP